MNIYLKITSLLFFTLILGSCGKQEQQKVSTSTHVYKVKPQKLHKTLHFTGTVQPLHENSLSSPIEAVVESMNVHYGQMVKKGDVLFTLNSTELQKRYNDILTDYLKAKESYSIAKAKFSGTQDLWNAGLLSKNNYLSEKSGINTARITLIQSTRKLTELLEKMDEDNLQNVSALTLADFGQIRKVLTSSHHIIRLKAPNDGVMLYSAKAISDKSSRITVGSLVKSGQVLALVGDLKGISVEIDVPEIDINQIHAGMTATISSLAFGRHQLKGVLVAVNAQASNSSSGGLPSFTAVVEVSELTPEQQPWIKVGMSAAIELNIDSDQQLLIPVKAVSREQGTSMVSVQLAQGTVKKIPIITGSVQTDTVVVEGGLKEGDVVLYD